MRTSLKKLRGALHRHGARERRDLRPQAQFGELARAYVDMQDMRDCYDSLLAAAAATTNSAYEFSESLKEMGACLLEKTALNDDEESGRVLLMLGKVQFELQRLVDKYRSHILQTITRPSESLLKELQTVEDMKRQCDEKREVYEYMRQREKGRSKGWKGETFSVQQLEEALNEYDEEATLFVFRLKSLKQGQSRSLLTQAARHHAAQLAFFKKALGSLEDVEPHVKQITEQQHIDYHFSGLEDDYGDEDTENNEDGSIARDEGELSFDYGQNYQDHDAVSSANHSSELQPDQADLTFPVVAEEDSTKENLSGRYRISSSFRGERKAASQSAPLFPGNNVDASHKLLQTRSSLTKKFSTYVLPMPHETRSPKFTTSANHNSQRPRASVNVNEPRQNLYFSSPLWRGEKFSASTTKSQSVLKESNKNPSAGVPPPLRDGLLYSRGSQAVDSDPKKNRRQSFSGPLTGKQWPKKVVTMEHPRLYSGPILRNRSPPLSSSPPKVSSSPRISPNTSPTFVSSPKISELHELPRPPASSTYKPLVGHSAPLSSKGPVLLAANKSIIPNSASPLPKPPSPVITRSFSIPSSSQKLSPSPLSKPVVATQVSEKMGEDIASPLAMPLAKT